MKARLRKAIPEVADERAVIDVPDELGYRLCREGHAVQMPPFTPATVEVTAEQTRALVSGQASTRRR